MRYSFQITGACVQSPDGEASPATPPGAQGEAAARVAPFMGSGSRALLLYNTMWHSAQVAGDEQAKNDLAEMFLHCQQLDDAARRARGGYVPDFLDAFMDVNNARHARHGLPAEALKAVVREAVLRLKRHANPVISGNIDDLVRSWNDGITELRKQ